jgi:hypothetical protein
MSLIITFMFEPGKAADELRERERRQEPPSSGGRSLS